jgi:hypothetical protein
MDLWLAKDSKKPRSSPGRVQHYIIDTSDVIGGEMASDPLTRRLGFTYLMSISAMGLDFVTLGAVSRPWDRAQKMPGREKFGVFSVRDFQPESWVGAYPNPAMLRMTERDGAWMARIIARFTAADLLAIVGAGRFSGTGDTEYLTQVLIERQHAIVARYLTRLSPLADVRASGDELCATDLARASGALPDSAFHYRVVEHAGGGEAELAVTAGADGAVCFRPRSIAHPGLADAAPERRVVFEVRNGTTAGPLAIHAYDLGERGMFVVGLTRSMP